ncbi:MAG: HAD family hydrolase [Dehalococcoidia bacterium]
MTIRAVIFDLGHTLWDFAPTEASRRYAVMRLYNRLYEAHGDGTPGPRELDRAFTSAVARWLEAWNATNDDLVQLPTDQLVREMLSTFELDADADLLRDLTIAVLGLELQMPVIDPHSLAAIATLHARGLSMGCVTNTLLLEEGILDVLTRLGLERYLDARVVSSAAGYRKPHASLFQRAIDDLGVAPHEAVFVGDRLYDDVSGAKAIGMRAVLTHQYRQEQLEGAIVVPDAVIRHVAELPDVIEGWREA